MYFEERKNCEIDGSELEKLSSYDFPLFCGCVEQAKEEDVIIRQEWAISKSGVIQLKRLIPLEILYANGHNAGSVGELWESHHREFAIFVIESDAREVLEIGGGHGKLARNALELNSALKWSIVEPNSLHKYENINYIDDFFSKKILDNTQFDTIVCSHFFEHLYHPGKFLHDVSSSAGGGGVMCISLPNMQQWLEKKWTNCLNYEHTLLFTENVLEFLFAQYGFVILKKQYFKEHSIFYRLEKCENYKRIPLKNEYKKNKTLFLSMLDFYKKEIVKLNELLACSDREIYLFGAHFFSQYLIYRGLMVEKIMGILDNDINKQGKRLYGTELLVFNPQILTHNDKALVILNTGAYNDEIEKKLLSINFGVEIVKF